MGWLEDRRDAWLYGQEEEDDEPAEPEVPRSSPVPAGHRRFVQAFDPTIVSDLDRCGSTGTPWRAESGSEAWIPHGCDDERWCPTCARRATTRQAADAWETVEAISARLRHMCVGVSLEHWVLTIPAHLRSAITWETFPALREAGVRALRRIWAGRGLSRGFAVSAAITGQWWGERSACWLPHLDLYALSGGHRLHKTPRRTVGIDGSFVDTVVTTTEWETLSPWIPPRTLDAMAGCVCLHGSACCRYCGWAPEGTPEDRIPLGMPDVRRIWAEELVRAFGYAVGLDVRSLDVWRMWVPLDGAPRNIGRARHKIRYSLRRPAEDLVKHPEWSDLWAPEKVSDYARTFDWPRRWSRTSRIGAFAPSQVGRVIRGLGGTWAPAADRRRARLEALVPVHEWTLEELFPPTSGHHEYRGIPEEYDRVLWIDRDEWGALMASIARTMGGGLDDWLE